MQVDSQTIEYYFTEKKPIRWPVHEKKTTQFDANKKRSACQISFFFFWLVWSSNDIVAQIQIGQRYPYFSMLESSYVDVHTFTYATMCARNWGQTAMCPRNWGQQMMPRQSFIKGIFYRFKPAISQSFFFFPFLSFFIFAYVDFFFF